MAENLQFKVSSALKNIIGRELITDDFIAVFELVKNAFDAYAKEVRIIFREDKIIIIDDGKGMDYDDLINKWLFLAYSAKREGEEDKGFESNGFKNYRDKIETKKFYAGAKGIGRFSCDRLGDELKLITKRAASNSRTEQLTINWKDFEVDAKEEFINIHVKHETLESVEYSGFKHGTILEISKLNSDWPREKKLELKHSLEKLINPFDLFDGKLHPGEKTFTILIESENDLEQDQLEKLERNKVNGPVQNFIFETLNLKTTQIRTEINESGEYITTELIDRGIPIYKIKEKNKTSPRLSNIKYHLFYLNRAAKINFKKVMGVDSVSFGSVFLYRNGFRVYPFGEEKEDSLGLDRRKQQKVFQLLGTRDLIGRIEIIDESNIFKETSSRDGGLIRTPSYYQLVDIFYEKCLKRLEKYVVSIQWQLEEDKWREDLSVLNNLDTKTKILRLISNLADSKDIVLLDYNKNFLNIIEEKLSEATPEVFENLTKIAAKTNDNSLTQEINKATKEYERFRKAAERTIREEKEEKARVEEELEEKKSENIFLKSIATRDFDQMIGMLHQVGIYAETIDIHLNRLFKKVKNGLHIEAQELSDVLQKIIFENNKILSFARFASKADYKREEQLTKEDLVSFIREYVKNIEENYRVLGLCLEVKGDLNANFIKQFKPIEIMIIVDNFLSNSKKHGARKVEFLFHKISSKELEIRVKDDGKGLDKTIEKPIEIFEKGFTTTAGSGLGLFHVKQILEELNGSISLNPELEKGIEFIIRISQ
ncbi:MAG: ATP-binding protein [Calditrichaceae bacterium]|nr:ATP-binding protein [Calditrichia bacterium]NUQ43218.1 ATP-binding protein [Calditrichaceae bacterium]